MATVVRISRHSSSQNPDTCRQPGRADRPAAPDGSGPQQTSASASPSTPAESVSVFTGAPLARRPGRGWLMDLVVLATAVAGLAWGIARVIGTVGVGYWIGTAGVVSMGAMWLVPWLWFRREAEYLDSLWDDIYFRLRARCQLVGELNAHLRRLLPANPRLTDDVQYLLQRQRMEQTNDLHVHAAVQNGLVLTVQSAVEQFHRSPEFQSDADIARTMEVIGKLDSWLAPMRDRFNRCVRSYNTRVKTPPFSMVARIGALDERPLFEMLVPWWSTDAAAYGQITGDEIRQQLRTSKAPLILAPSPQAQPAGGSCIVHVRVPPEHSPCRCQ
jgi:hypothetical protein